MPRRPLFATRPGLWIWLACFLAGAPLSADAPRIDRIELRGLRIGVPNTLTITGAHLTPAPQIVCPWATVRQAVREGAKSDQVQLDVEFAARVQPGIYPLRVATSQGISNVVAIAVDRLAEQPFASETSQLPVALHGTVAGGQRLETRFAGGQGDRFVAEIESRRLGSQLKPVLRLLDAQGTQIAWAAGRVQLDGDARLEVDLPHDGEFVLQLHDVLYRAAANSFFRLKVGDFPFADLVYPLGVQRGQAVRVFFPASSLPSSATVRWISPTAPFQEVCRVPVPSIAGFSGTRPRVMLSDHVELQEGKHAEATVGEMPVAINGSISQTGETDRFALGVTPGSKLRIEVFAARFGSPLDGVLVLLDQDGKTLASNDDRPGIADPGLDFTVPQNVESLVLSLRDLQHRGGPEFIYRVVAKPIAPADYQLALDVDRLNIPNGGSQTIRLDITRRNFPGAIELTAPGLPDAIRLAGTNIVPGATVALLTLSAPPDQSVHGAIRIVGRSLEPPQPLYRVARRGKQDVSQRFPWRTTEVGWATETTPKVTINWEAEERLTAQQGDKLAARLRLSRAETATDKIRVRLLSTQIMPQKEVEKDGKKQRVNDTERALRLENEPLLEAGVQETTVQILVPADLPIQDWGLVFRAELLSKDEKSVVSASTTAARTLGVTASAAAPEPAETRAEK